MKGSRLVPSQGWVRQANPWDWTAEGIDSTSTTDRLAALYVTHAPRVARWAARLGGPSIDVEDAVHDVFVIVERKLKSFRGDASFTTWLYGITQNVVRHARRKNRMRRWLFGDDVALRRLASPDKTPIEALETHEAIALCYAILDRLSEKYRTVLILHAIEGLSGSEIASLTGVKLATVWVRLHRARASFLAALKKREEASR